MAKLSKKQSIHVAFLANKLALTYGNDERQALLTALLDALHIDADLRTETAGDAKRSVAYDARRQRKAQAAADVATTDLQRRIDELHAHRDALIDKLTQRLPAGTERPEPAPIVTEADTYNVTAKQRRALAAFDDLTDGEQVDQLRAMGW